MSRGGCAKVNVPALSAALDAARQARGMSWRMVADEVGVCAATMSRVFNGDQPDTGTFVSLVWWLGQPAEAFIAPTAAGAEVATPALDAELAALLLGRPDLTAADVDFLTETASAALRWIRARQ